MKNFIVQKGRVTIALGLMIAWVSGYRSIAVAAEPMVRLLPFQGFLTDASGKSLRDGVRTAQFKLYDSPVGGESLWAGEVHRLTVNNGVVNTILGSKIAIPETYPSNNDVPMFSRPVYLEITVDANEDDAISQVDPPLLPRQVVLPALFAARSSQADLATRSETSGVSDSLSGFGWSSIMTQLDPSRSFLKTERIENRSITEEKLSPSILIPVGTVIQSLLPPDIHPVSVGDPQTFDPVVSRWVLADGERNISNTKYGKLTNQQFTPDLRGVFLRGINHGRSDIYQDPDGERPPGNLQNFAVQHHEHEIPIGYHENPDVAGWAMSHLNNAIGSHRGKSYPAGTASETRPTNVAVLHYLKVN